MLMMLTVQRISGTTIIGLFCFLSICFVFFLERGYYLPIETLGSIQNIYDVLTDPLVLAIDLGDAKLVDEILTHYNTTAGQERIKALITEIDQFLETFTDEVSNDDEGSQKRGKMLQFYKNTLSTISAANSL